MNRAEQRKYHVIYKTTCTVTGKYYLGMHSTDNINDGYLGSGSILSRSVKKYGKENHVYEVLEFLPDRKSLSLREEQIITDEHRKNPMCMNIRTGGTGNQPGKALTEETKAKMSASLKKMWANLKESGYKKQKQSAETIANRVAKNTGKKRTEETRQKMREAQAAYLATVTPEKRAEEHANRSRAKSQSWIVETPSGKITVTNIKKFAIENGTSISKLYKTVVNGKYSDGFRILRKA